MTTPKKTVEWASLDFNDRKWLPVDVKLESVSSVIRNLDLRHINVTDRPALFDSVDESKIIGFVCTSDKAIKLDQLEDYSKSWSFIPVRIQNSTLTIQILNLCAINGKHRNTTYNYMLEKYLCDSSSKENCTLSNSVYAITPVSFAHNVAARDFPAKNTKQQIMVFARLSETIVQIDQNGRLQTFNGSNLSPKEFFKFARDKLNCQVYTITEDPFKELSQRLEAKKAELADFLEEKNLDKTNPHLDESLNYRDLKELSQLSEQIEDAENFELLIDNGALPTVQRQESPKVASSSTNTIVHQFEQQIRELLKQIEDLKKVFPHIYWPEISDSDLYGSKEYLRFYSHYKKFINMSAPELLKTYAFTPIRTPKSVKSRKRSGSTSSSLNEQPTVANATPKRRRSSRMSGIPSTSRK